MERWRQLAVLSLAELLALCVWFSASAVLPALRREWALGDGGAAALTIAVQAGFIVGTLGSALANLPDVWPARSVMVAGAALGRAGQRAARADRARPRPRAGAALRHRGGHGRRLPARDEDHGHVVPGRARAGPRDPRRRAHGRLRRAPPDPRRHRPAVASDPARRLGAGPAGSRPRGGLRARGAVRLPGRPLRRAHGRRDLPGPGAAPGLPRLPRPHVGAVRDVGVDRRVHGRQPARARRRRLPGRQRQRRDLRGDRASARSAAGRAASSPTGGDARR